MPLERARSPLERSKALAATTILFACSRSDAHLKQAVPVLESFPAFAVCRDGEKDKDRRDLTREKAWPSPAVYGLASWQSDNLPYTFH